MSSPRRRVLVVVGPIYLFAGNLLPIRIGLPCEIWFVLVPLFQRISVKGFEKQKDPTVCNFEIGRINFDL